VCVCVCVCVYRVSREECARLREGVPYVKVYRYNPKHLCPKLNGYGDNGQRKVWSTCGSTHCTCQLTILSISALECGVMTAIQLTLATELHAYFLQGVVQFTAALGVVGRLVVRSCYNAFCVFPRGIL